MQSDRLKLRLHDEGPIEMHLLQRGELIPHFEVTTLGGERINYATLW